LHRKLRESNLSLAAECLEFSRRHYSLLQKDLNQIYSASQGSQTAIQDVSGKMRRVAEDLYRVDDQLDAILSCVTLPILSDLSQHPTVHEWSISAPVATTGIVTSTQQS
jgi:hypothetical protein